MSAMKGGRGPSVVTVTRGLAPGDGADLYFERRGAGPALLLITGGGGDCGYYAGLAEILASDFTVVSYDRRGNSRSRLHGAPRPSGLTGNRLNSGARNQDAGSHAMDSP